MAIANGWLFDVLPVLQRLPPDTWFDNGRKSGELELQANTLKGLREITAAFPGAVWRKTWREDHRWWEYATAWDGVHIRIYGVREGPANCTAIFETRAVEKQIPVTFKTEMVEEQVLVGWDCGAAQDGESADLGLVAVPETEEVEG